jgi:hypothetical protein
MKYFLLAMFLIFPIAARAQMIEATDPPYNMVCDGVTNTGNSFRAAAAYAASVHGTLHISAQDITGSCVIDKSPSGNFVLQTSAPWKLSCDSSIWLSPDASVTSATDVLYLIGSPWGGVYQTEIDYNIGNPLGPTRNGRHGLVLDAIISGNYFPHFSFKGQIQAGTAGGYGILATSNPINNPNGGIYLSTFGDHQSVIQGGVNLNGVGDSITIGGNISYNSAPGAANNGITVTLAPTAGGLLLDSLNFSQCGGVQINSGSSVEIRGGEYELQCPLTITAVIDINGFVGTIFSAQIHPASLSAVAGIGTPRLINIEANAIANLSNVYIATPTSYTPVHNASTNFTCGSVVFFTGVPHITGTAPSATLGSPC